MNSVERVKAICKERRIPVSRLEKDLGYANGYIGQLRKGVFPDDRLVNIAEYLGVSTDYLLGTEKEKLATPKSDELVDAIIMSRDGKTIKRKYTKEQSDHLQFLLDSIPFIEDEEL